MLAGEFGIPGFDAAAFGKFMGDSQTSIGSLTALITDMKGTIDFLSKYVEEKKNEPVVTTTFIGEVE
jgi:hypothetical protein